MVPTFLPFFTPMSKVAVGCCIVDTTRNNNCAQMTFTQQNGNFNHIYAQIQAIPYHPLRTTEYAPNNQWQLQPWPKS